MKTLISELTKKIICQKCNEDIEEDDQREELPCGDFLCQNCVEKYKNVDRNQICMKNHKYDKIDLMNELKLSDYMDQFSIQQLKCPIHESIYEYFSKTDSKFACIQCLKEVLQNDFSSQEIIPITSKDIVFDLLQMQQKLDDVKERIEQILKGNFKDGYEVSQIFTSIIKFSQFLDQSNSFRDSLKVCTQQTNISLQSKVHYSNLKIDPSTKINKLNGFSKIITSDQEENFINSLFEKKYELGFLFRASEHNYSADKFHKLCNNQGPTLIIYLSKQGRKFGGYADRNWSSEFKYRKSNNSFLFSLHFYKKLRLLKNYGQALFFKKNKGPCFGEDLVIGDLCNQENSCSSQLGNSYEVCEGYEGSYEAQKSLAGSPKFSLKDYEVYKIRMINQYEKQILKQIRINIKIN